MTEIMAKVLHLTTGVSAGGGAEKMLLSTLPYLKSAEHAVCVLKGRGEIGARLEERGVKVFYLEMKGYFDFGVIKRYKEVVKYFKPDLQVNYLIHADVFGRIFAKRAGVKKIVSYIRNRHIKTIFKIFDFLTLSSVDYLLTNSNAVLSCYRRSYRFPEKRSTCISNGIDLTPSPEFDREKLKGDLGISNDDFIVISTSRLHQQKDLPTLLRALAIVKEKEFVRPKLLLCSFGPEKEKLEELVQGLGLVEDVKFLGIRSDVSDLLRIADVFVLPSKHEGMSNSLMEAMKEGCPVIVSAIPENTELVKDKENGLTFATGNETALAEKIMAIAASPLIAGKLAEGAKKTIADYDIKKIINELNVFFETRLNEKSKIVWVANDRNQVTENFFNSLGEEHQELDLFLIAGNTEASEGNDKFFRWKVFKFSLRKLFSILVSPFRLAAKMKGRKIDIINLDFYNGLYSLLCKENPDLVMVNLYLQPTSHQALLYCLIHQKPLILLEEKKHLGKTKVRRALSLILLAISAPLFLYAKKVCCYTVDAMNFGRRYFPIFNKNKIDLLPAVVDTRIFYNKHLPKNDSRLRILMVARMIPLKRYEDALQAVKMLKFKKPFDFVLSICGQGPMEEKIKSLIEEYDIKDKVEFLPALPNDRMPEYYANNDVLILPSSNEAIGMVVLEAMACGMPAIVSRACGAASFIKDGVNGYVFNTFDFLGLAEKLTLLSDRKRLEEFGQAAEKMIKEEFDSRVVAKNFFEKIKNLL